MLGITLMMFGWKKNRADAARSSSSMSLKSRPSAVWSTRDSLPSNSDVSEKRASEKATITQNRPYDETKIKKAEIIIKTMLAEKGRQKAEVEVTTKRFLPTAFWSTFNVTKGRR